MSQRTHRQEEPLRSTLAAGNMAGGLMERDRAQPGPRVAWTVITATMLLAAAVGMVGAPAAADAVGFSATFVRSFPTTGVTLSSPRSVALAPSGNLYVIDAGNSRVVQFGSSGTFAAQWDGASG